MPAPPMMALFGMAVAAIFGRRRFRFRRGAQGAKA
ncbi:MYXO-CTERM sorting domain-containing protein [Qipengyuania psychrotolerans]|nr:MYXO-CTERM sorting domain-containing protein [Qipengyuania psychrotolerans]